MFQVMFFRFWNCKNRKGFNRWGGDIDVVILMDVKRISNDCGNYSHKWL